MTPLSQCRSLVTDWFSRLRRPKRREWAWIVGGALALFVLYLLALVPLTPSISDIRKARLEQPAQVMSEDGKLLAEYKWANRAWVPIKDIAPSVVAALIATEDHRFYDHFGMD